MADDQLTQHLIALEEERCRAIVGQRFDRLSELLSERLTHTHARGNHDDKGSYLAFAGGVIESLELVRSDLRVTLLGDAAVMHGKQVNRARKRGAPEVIKVESMVTQVWAREDDGVWRVLAFHASALGALPPAVR